MIASPARPALPRPPAGGDDGFSLVELMTAMAVFSILMAMVAAATISGFNGIKDIMTRSDQRQQSDVAAEWIARALTYAVIPEGVTPASAIDSATTTSIRFYTNASIGLRNGVPYNEVPYLVDLSAATQGDGTKWIVVKQYTPTRIAGGWTYPALTSPTVTRTLLRLPKTSSTPMGILVHSCDPTTGCSASDLNVTLPMTSSTIAAPRVPSYVQFTVGNTNDARNVISQRVRLVNLS